MNNRPRFPHLARRQRQAGATAVLAAIAMVAMLTATMLAVEIGRLYGAHRDLQKLASMASMDAVRVVGGCDTVEAPPAADVHARVLDSLARNHADPSIVASSGNVATGYVTTFNSNRQLQSSTTDEATAVGVTLTRPMPTPLIPLLPSNAGQSMTTQAVATQDVIGALSIGTSLVSLDSTRSALLDSILGGMLGGAVTLDAITWQGLASAAITLDDLVLAADVASVEDLLEQNLDREEALQIIADALGASGNATLANAVASLAAIPDAHGTPLEFGDVLAIEDSLHQVAGSVPLNAADLILALAETSIAGYPITLALDSSSLGLINPNLAAVTVALRIGEPRQIAVGRPGYREDGTPRTQARTSQVYVEIAATIRNVGALLGVGALSGNPLLDLRVVAELAQGSAILREVRCARSGQPHHALTADVQTGLAKVAIGRYSSMSANPPVLQPLGPLLTVPGVLGPTLTILLNDTIEVSTGEDNSLEDFDGPFVPRVATIDPVEHVRVVGGVDDALSGLVGTLGSGLADEISFGGTLGIVLNALGPVVRLTRVTNLLDPVLDAVDSVLSGLLDVAGLQLGTATVTVQSLEVKQPIVFVKD